jgi:hypothetical protein
MPKELKELGIPLGIGPPWLITTPSQLKQSLLEAHWRQWPIQYEIPSNSQIFGRLLVNSGFEGIQYPSTKGKKNCIAIFLENLVGSKSYIELVDTPPPGVSYKKLDADTWQNLS